MELRQLEHFKAVAELSSFSQAAEKLYVTQSALSKSIFKLEAEIGFPLFDRIKNKVSLNPAGHQFLEYTNRVLREMDSLEQFVRRTREDSLPIRIVASDSVSLRHVIPTLTARLPDLEIIYDVVPEEEIPDMLVNHTATAAITMKQRVDLRIAYLPLYQEKLMCYVPKSHRLYDREVLHIQDLHNEVLIVAESNEPFVETTLAKLAQENCKPIVRRISDWVVFTNTIRNTKHLSFSSNISERYVPPGANARNIPIGEQIPGVTVFDYFFAYEKDSKKVGELYLKCKSCFL